ncbi:hypothetical protein LCGC14_1359260, partial [marine sediment metagenome]
INIVNQITVDNLFITPKTPIFTYIIINILNTDHATRLHRTAT